MKTIIILPNIDERQGGVAAFGLQLARRMETGIGGAEFVIPDQAVSSPGDVELTRIHKTKRSVEALVEILESTHGETLLLHYVGFGYALNACPDWLVNGLAIWKRGRISRKIAVYFHELATEEAWYRRVYWTQRLQRRIISDICRITDRIATNCPYFGEKLIRYYGVPPDRLRIVPIPPTLANSSRVFPSPPSARALTAIVLGLWSTRRRALACHHRLLKTMAEAGLLRRLLVVGHGATTGEAARLRAIGIDIEAHADVDAKQLTELSADVGLVWNWPSILTKSTVFANLCALGIPAVIAQSNGSPYTGLPIDPLTCSGSRASVQATVAALSDPMRRLHLRNAAQKLATTVLDWSSVTASLESHFMGESRAVHEL